MQKKKQSKNFNAKKNLKHLQNVKKKSPKIQRKLKNLKSYVTHKDFLCSDSPEEESIFSDPLQEDSTFFCIFFSFTIFN